MADEILNGDDILVEFAENNILSVDPNRIYTNNGVIDRLVKPENLTIYANLKARVVPRSKLISGIGIDSQMPESFVDIFSGDINFLKPGNKDYLTTDWTDVQTGKMNEEGNVFNQKINITNIDPWSGQETNENITNKLNSESFGIESITVTLNKSYVPQVNITFIDVRGQTLFEQGYDSPYGAFFQYPYPEFRLVLKGYYGKAVQYQLALLDFKATFDANSGNYVVACKFIGRTLALLNDINLGQLRAAPYMFSKTYEVVDETSDREAPTTVITSRGRQTLEQVYTSYKTLGLVPQNLPHLTLDELVEKLKGLDGAVEKQLKEEDLDSLDDIEIYRTTLDSYRGRIVGSGGWKSIYMELSEQSDLSPYEDPSTQVRYYRWKQQYVGDAQKRDAAIKKLQNYINKYNHALADNKTFGKAGKYAIPIDIVYNDFIGSAPIGFESYTYNWFVFDILINSFDVKTANIFAVYTQQSTRIEEKLTDSVNSVVLQKLGFKPTIRNIFAIIIAQADTFLRLLDSTHTQAFEMRSSPRRVAALSEGANPSDNELPEPNMVYPWPSYYQREENSQGGASFVSRYPGSTKVIETTKAYDPILWPEVDFVENYMRALKIKDVNTAAVFADPPVSGENWLPITSFDLLENTLYINTSYTAFNYEIWDRSFVHTFLGGFSTRWDFNIAKDLLNNLSFLETLNIGVKSNLNYDIQEKLKNQNFNYNTFLEYLNEIAPLTNYQLLIRDEYSTPYIREKVNNGRYEFIPLTSFIGATYYTGDDINPQVQLLNNVLQSPARSNDPTQTYPFDESGYDLWAPLNVAGGLNIESFQNFNDIFNSLRFSESQKTYSSFRGFPTLQFFVSGEWIDQGSTVYYNNLLTDRTTHLLGNTGLKFNSLYESLRSDTNLRRNTKLFLTEGSLDYSATTTVGDRQITSMLNTPYFINGLVEGIKNEINEVTNPYVSAAYLFLNSLPLSTLREKTLGEVGGPAGTSSKEFGDYIAKVFNQVSAAHPLPYAWILRYGSIWHRYKTYINKGTDILSGVWQDFDANTNFNATNGLSHQYNLNVGPNNSAVLLAGQTAIGGNFTQLNVGFYPELNNYISYFVTGNLLYEGTNITGNPISSNDINAFLNDGTIVLNTANNLTINTDPTPTNPQDMSCSFWYNYYDTTRDALLSGNTTPQYILFPSAGGMYTEQAQFEVDTRLDLLNNPSVHNGGTRLAWALSNYGYFKHNSVTYPSPTQYLKSIDPTRDDQYSFNITSNNAYNSIEELFDIFTPDILDDFETYFLNFCETSSDFNYNSPIFTGSTVLGQILAGTPATIGDPMNQSSGSYKTFQSVLRDILTVDQSTVESATDNTQLSYNLGQAQLSTLTTTLQKFLSQEVVFNFYNPTDMDIRVLRTFVGEEDYFNFGSYTGNLPPNISLSDSQFTNPQTWRTLQLEVGFYDPINIQNSGTTSPLVYGDNGSYVTDFFSEMDIDFTPTNVQRLRKVIRMYVTQRIQQEGTTNYGSLSGNSPTSLTFKTTIQTGIIEVCNEGQFTFLNQLFQNLKFNLPLISETTGEEFEKSSTFQTDENKLEQYLLFKALNDKWISGENFNDRLLFKDFLFFDNANRDIGDDAIITTDKIKTFSNPDNAKLNLYSALGLILQGNNFLFLGLPSYINFYGTTSTGDREIPKYSTQQEANSVFGTHLEVDYLESSPKFLIQYVGEPSTHLENPRTNYANDSFILGRTSDNPFFSNCYDPDRCNKVVSFVVDFGIQSQSIFKGISLDQNQFKNTSESFVIQENLAASANDNDVSTQGMGLYNIYKTRSYTCTVTCMGNVCIQPTMYFTLRHVPMFNGPYLILDVEHSVQGNTMTTTFTGVRVPFHRLPLIENLVARVNKTFVQKIRKKIQAERKAIARGGFEPEGDDELRSKKPGNIKDSNKKMIIVHVTAGINYGADPVGNINRQHKNRGFSGIGYHYLISRGSDGSAIDGTLYGARPETYRGAHCLGKNNNIGISMIANCAKMGTYDTRGGEMPTDQQKKTLEWTLLYVLLKKGIMVFDNGFVKFPDHKKPAPIIGADESVIPFADIKKGNGVTKSMWGKVIKGHNEFANKRCPCFRMEEALTSGTLTTNLNTNLGAILGTVTQNFSSYGVNTAAGLALVEKILASPLSEGGCALVPTPYPNDTTWSSGNAQTV